MRSEVEQLHSELELNRSGTHSSPERPKSSNREDDHRSNDIRASESTGSSMDLADREKFGILEVFNLNHQIF